MVSNGTQTREIALNILKEVNQDGRYANISLKEHLRKNAYSERDASFITQLVYGTLEKQITIDWIIQKYASHKKIHPLIMNILRLGCYQILFLDRVPDSAACNEAVKLCKKHGLFQLQGFVNGLLRNVVRNKETLQFPMEGLSRAENLSLAYSYPQWLVDKWLKNYGDEMTVDILRQQEMEDHITIRVNTRDTTPERLMEGLKHSGVEVQQGIYMPEALSLKKMGDIEANPLYQEGLFTVQGESSMLVTAILDPQPGEHILDACSSPGGKATHAAERMQGKGSIRAWDVHTHRVDLIRRNSSRLKIDMIAPELWDATKADPTLARCLDRVLIDAPCSGWGIIHKKPDIKLNVKAGEYKELVKLQLAILRTCSSYVRPGGILVYSTCTINPDENEKMIQHWLSEQSDFIMDDILPFLPEGLKKSAPQYGMIQLIPSRHYTDGFFIARLKRKE